MCGDIPRGARGLSGGFSARATDIVQHAVIKCRERFALTGHGAGGPQA